MKKKINLSLKEDATILPAHQIFLILKIIVIFFVIVSLAIGALVWMQSTRLERLETDYQEMLKKTTEIEALSLVDLNAKQKSLELLQSKAKVLTQSMKWYDEGLSFSKVLSALSQAYVPGVWLTHIDIDYAQRSLSFEGEAKNPEFVVNMIQNLKQQERFENRKVDNIELEQDDDFYHFKIKGDL